MYKKLVIILFCILIFIYLLQRLFIFCRRENYSSFQNYIRKIREADSKVNKEIKTTWDSEKRKNYDNAIGNMNTKEKYAFNLQVISKYNQGAKDRLAFQAKLRELEAARAERALELEKQRLQENKIAEENRIKNVENKKSELEDNLDIHVKTIQSNLKQNLKYNLYKREEKILDDVNDKLSEYKNIIYGYNQDTSSEDQT